MSWHSKIARLFVFPCLHHQMGFSLECQDCWPAWKHLQSLSAIHMSYIAFSYKYIYWYIYLQKFSETGVMFCHCTANWTPNSCCIWLQWDNRTPHPLCIEQTGFLDTIALSIFFPKYQNKHLIARLPGDGKIWDAICEQQKYNYHLTMYLTRCMMYSRNYHENFMHNTNLTSLVTILHNQFIMVE